jgi:hypothetical protein
MYSYMNRIGLLKKKQLSNATQCVHKMIDNHYITNIMRDDRCSICGDVDCEALYFI